MQIGLEKAECNYPWCTSRWTIIQWLFRFYSDNTPKSLTTISINVCGRFWITLSWWISPLNDGRLEALERRHAHKSGICLHQLSTVGARGRSIDQGKKFSTRTGAWSLHMLCTENNKKKNCKNYPSTSLNIHNCRFLPCFQTQVCASWERTVSCPLQPCNNPIRISKARSKFFQRCQNFAPRYLKTVSIAN
jgi:hypothetical protein